MAGFAIAATLVEISGHPLTGLWRDEFSAYFQLGID